MAVCAELLQRWYYWKLLEFFKAASELSGEGSLLSILVQSHFYTLKVHAMKFRAAPDLKLVVQAVLVQDLILQCRSVRAGGHVMVTI